MSGQRIGYVRVSTLDQKPERQLDGVVAERVFTDHASGKDVRRPQLEALLGFAREGDTVVVHSMDRLSVMGAFAEFERSLIRERQKEGIALAKQRGAYKGRKKSLSQAVVAELRQRLTTGMSKAQVARELGISRQTLYQYLREGEGTS